MNDIAPITTNSSFSATVPALQTAWDSASFDNLCKCPRYYKLHNIDGWTTPFENDHIKFGSIFHSATELYDHQRAANLDHQTALLSVVRYVLLETWDPKLRRPWQSTEPTKTRDTLLRSVIVYLDRFQDDNLKTVQLANGKPAVELSFSIELDGFIAADGTVYKLCGHLDKVVDFNDGLWILDKKTTKSELNDDYFKQFSPNNQVSIYQSAGLVIFSREIDGFLIDAVQVLVNGTRFRRKPIPRPQEILDEWLKDFHIRVRENETYVANNHWPQNPKACGFGRMSCAFRSVCSSEPSVRDELLEALFIKRIWDPLIPR